MGSAVKLSIALKHQLQTVYRQRERHLAHLFIYLLRLGNTYTPAVNEAIRRIVRVRSNRQWHLQDISHFVHRFGGPGNTHGVLKKVQSVGRQSPPIERRTKRTYSLQSLFWWIGLRSSSWPHDDIMTWNALHISSPLWGIHLLLTDSLHKVRVMPKFRILVAARLHKCFANVIMPVI